jgi:hypothetical protein
LRSDIDLKRIFLGFVAIMDSDRRRKLLVLLGFQVFLFFSMEQATTASVLAIHQHLERINSIIMIITCLRVARKRHRSFWARKRVRATLG